MVMTDLCTRPNRSAIHTLDFAVYFNFTKIIGDKQEYNSYFRLNMGPYRPIKVIFATDMTLYVDITLALIFVRATND